MAPKFQHDGHSVGLRSCMRVPPAVLPPPVPEPVVPQAKVEIDVVHVELNNEIPIQMPGNVVNIISDSSDSSGDFWRVIEEFYASDSDPDSVLPLPGVPSFPGKHGDSPANSSSGHSHGPASSNASNATPIKKEK
ncbi:UNVERIFIED_CONTAM: hypothetical protein Slati_1504500 [Sesamum latifolium]|uniref:Uncharacterized protein n=1 Tax=Sesamum latifolium TaxID=2727402 RepID=A0AAW2X782_9LAMI